MSESNGNTSRYAIYFCPGSGSPLLDLGSHWLGRDVITGKSLDPDLPDSIRHEHWVRATDSPRRYGFHATLKPPFRLADNTTVEELQAALRKFAVSQISFCAPPLVVSEIGRFLALTLSEWSENLSVLAAECVSEFDRFRALPTALETEQRLRGALSPREREHVVQWGYPYVFDTWRFHMSLTSSMHNESRLLFQPHLRERFEAACKLPLLVDSICIFHEPYPGGPFQLLDRVNLRAR